MNVTPGVLFKGLRMELASAWKALNKMKDVKDVMMYFMLEMGLRVLRVNFVVVSVILAFFKHSGRNQNIHKCHP